MSTDPRTVLVDFVDADTDQVLARSEIAASRLPDSFAMETTLHLGDEPWLVVAAEPLTAAQFVPAGRLVLTVRRLGSASLDDILYSLPTICDGLPAVGPVRTPADSLELHEDDWRQVELVSLGLAAAINAELAAIRRVYEQHGQRDADGRIFAFRSVHVRSIVPLAEPLPWPRIRELLPVPQHEYGGVSFRGSAGVAIDSFAFDVGDLSWYGIVERDAASVLALGVDACGGPASAAHVEPILRAFDLTLVDWCLCAAIGPDNLTDYFRAIGTA